MKRDHEQYLTDIIHYEAPFRHCYFFKNEIWLRYIAVYNANNILIYFGVYAILNKMNLIALIYWIFLYLVNKMNFKPMIFK